jgi:PAS domain S-box-containing protein
VTNTRGITIILAAISVAMIGINILVSLRTSRVLRDHAQGAIETQVALEQGAHLMLRLVEMEAGQRGYIISGDESYLDVFQQGKALALERLGALESYVPTSPSNADFVNSFRPLVEEKIADLERSMEVRRNDGFDAAKSLVSKDAGKTRLDRIGENFETYRENENRELFQRSVELENAYRATYLSSLATGFAVSVAFLSFLYSGMQLYRSLVLKQGQLQAKSDLLQTTLASIGDGVVTIDCQGKIVDVNEVAEELLGVDRESALEGLLNERLNLIDATTREPVTNPCEEAIQSKRRTPFNKNVLLVRPDGQEFPIEDAASPIIDEEGNVSGCILIIRNVSERWQYETRLRESEATFRSLFDLAPIGIADIALDGTLNRVNEKFCKIIDKRNEELEKIKFTHLIEGDHRLGDLNLISSAMRGEMDSFNLEKRFSKSRGRTVWAELSIRLLRNSRGEPVSWIAAATDITERRLAEEMRVRLATIVNAANDAIISKSVNGIIESWNPAAERLFGYTPEEIIGKPITTIVSSDYLEEEVQAVRKLLQGEIVLPFRSKRLHRDGRQIEVLLSLSALFDADGKPLGVSTIIKDLTSELATAAELSRSETRFQALADNMSQLAWMANRKGTIYWYNKRWYEYTGTNSVQMFEQGWEFLLHPDHAERVLNNLAQCFEQGADWEDTFPLLGADGEYTWFLSRALPIHNEAGEITQWFGSSTDITQIVEKEDQLQLARIAAESASKSRGEFLANMSHEIRTPMTAIMGHADLLSESLTDPNDMKSLETIRRNGKFLLQIINDILDLSRIDAGKLPIERTRVSLSELLGEIHSLLDVRAVEKGIEFRIEIDGKIPKFIETDPVRFRQIVINLVSNAIKFTDAGSITVVCRHLPEQTSLELKVKDTGVGISETTLANLFQPFVQADSSSTRAYEGTGLGLAISRRLAIALGGDISVESVLGAGSTFTVLTQIGDCRNEEMIDQIDVVIIAQTPPPTLEKFEGTVLVVDDRRDIRFIVQSLIEKAGGKVMTAANGLEAVNLLLSHDPALAQEIDLVLMDMQMPIMDGYTAVAKLREGGFRKPIIALTANAMKEDRDRCLECGCDDYATKPLDGPTLIRRLATLINC